MEIFHMNAGRVYESVDNKSLSWDVSQRSTEDRIHAAKGYRKLICCTGGLQRKTAAVYSFTPSILSGYSIRPISGDIR